MPQRRNKQRLAEMKPRVERGEWVIGGRKLAITHFWVADGVLSLCGSTFHKGDFEGKRRCKQCSTQYQKIMDGAPASPKRPEFVGILNPRGAITSFIHWVREWEYPDTEIIMQALWLLNLAGVANSGVHENIKLKVLTLMRDLAKGDVHPNHALELLKGWETNGQAD